MAVLNSFVLDVAAETTDMANNANKSYWAEAQANWSFNGTGTVTGYNAANQPSSFTWTSTGAADTPPPNDEWKPVKAPTPESIGGPVYNDAASRMNVCPAGQIARNPGLR